MRLIDAGALAFVLEEWEEKACDGTENDGSDGTTRVLHPVPTTTREMIDLIADQPTIEDKTEDFMLAISTLTEHHAKEKLEWLKMIKDIAEYCSKWIPVTERLPEDNRKVLICSEKGTVLIMSYDHYWETWRGFSSIHVTHWMPLPKPPECEIKEVIESCEECGFCEKKNERSLT